MLTPFWLGQFRETRVAPAAAAAAALSQTVKRGPGEGDTWQRTGAVWRSLTPEPVTGSQLHPRIDTAACGKRESPPARGTPGAGAMP